MKGRRGGICLTGGRAQKGHRTPGLTELAGSRLESSWEELNKVSSVAPPAVKSLTLPVGGANECGMRQLHLTQSL